MPLSVVSCSTRKRKSAEPTPVRDRHSLILDRMLVASSRPMASTDADVGAVISAARAPPMRSSMSGMPPIFPP
jgi:hypothetical protein